MANSKSEVITAFKGINRRGRGDKEEFLQAENVCADEYPCLVSIKAPKKIYPVDEEGNAITNIRAALCPNDGFSELFSGVAGTDFYYKGKKIPFFGDAEIPPEGKIEIEKMNGNIIICCYNNFGERAMLYYNFCGYALDKRKLSKGYVIRVDCANFSARLREGTDFLPAAKSATDSSCYRIYHDSDTFFSDVYVGDSIEICNLEAREMKKATYQYARETLIRESRYSPAKDTDEVSCIVTKKDIGENLSYIEYTAYNTEGEAVEALGFTQHSLTNQERFTPYSHVGPVFRKAMPVINSICVHNNRLWATNPNGEYIYASKLGEFREFNCFNGVASDSYYMGIGSNGGFVGLVSYRSYVVAFKEDCIHLISGSSPSSFSLSRTVEGIGCTDIRSCAQVGGYLYFLSRNGFYRFDGITFENISKKLGTTYISAVGAGKGDKYYVSATDKNGKRELLVFDTRYSLWHTVADIGEAVGLFAYDGEMYVATTDTAYILEKGKSEEWKTESCEFFEDSCENKYPNHLWIRAKIDKGRSIRVFTKEDGGEYTEHMSCKGTGKMKIYSVPIRWNNAKSHQIKLLGNGGALIYTIETVNAEGGREHRRF